MRFKLIFLSTLFLISISCKSEKGNSTEPSTTTETTPKIETPKIEITMLEDIGYWAMPITNQISNIVTLKFDKSKGMYYTLEKMSNENKVDSSGVIVKKKNGGYHIEYIATMNDNYSIDKNGAVVWHCPGYADVRCSSKININNLAETFQLYKPDANSLWAVASSLTAEQMSNIYDWSKEYVKACVVRPETLVFPVIKDVKFFSRSDLRYKIEYKVAGKNLYNESVTYPVSVFFETPEEPVFNTISLE